MDGPATAPGHVIQRPNRATRSDARRNEEAVLKAAKELFAEAGVSAPARDVAARAGVGLGTLYRRFPTRGDLVAAVFTREVDSCSDAAAVFSEELEPTTRWSVGSCATRGSSPRSGALQQPCTRVIPLSHRFRSTSAAGLNPH